MDQSLVSLICIKREMVIKSRPLKAGIAQLVERNLAKVEVAGSNPVSRSNKKISIQTTFKVTYINSSV